MADTATRKRINAHGPASAPPAVGRTARRAAASQGKTWVPDGHLSAMVCADPPSRVTIADGVDPNVEIAKDALSLGPTAGVERVATMLAAYQRKLHAAREKLAESRAVTATVRIGGDRLWARLRFALSLIVAPRVLNVNMEVPPCS